MTTALMLLMLSIGIFVGLDWIYAKIIRCRLSSVAFGRASMTDATALMLFIAFATSPVAVVAWWMWKDQRRPEK